MIPKIIHYIWLGGKELPPIAKKCIASWQKYCPDYEIKRWDESNLDLDKYQFVKDALDAKKYAFASDVLRTDVLYNNGGIYFDIDVELLKPIDEFLSHDCFMGFETSNLLNPGLILGTIAQNQDLQNILEIYKKTTFDINNLRNLTVCEIFTQYYEQKGLVRQNKTHQIENTVFYASEYFSPKSLTDGVIRKTKNTVAIHHYCASWVKKSTRITSKIKQFIKRILGEKLVNRLKNKRNKNESSTSSSK